MARKDLSEEKRGLGERLSGITLPGGRVLGRHALRGKGERKLMGDKRDALVTQRL